MKRFISIMVCVSLLFVFTSCSDDPIALVQNGYLGEYTSLTVQEILDGHYKMFYNTTVWDGGTSDSGEEIVQVQYSDSIFDTEDTVTIQFKVYNFNIFKITAFIDPDYEIIQPSDLAATLNYLYFEQYAVHNREMIADESKVTTFLETLEEISGSAVLYGASSDYSEDRGKLCSFFNEKPLDMSTFQLLDHTGLVDMDDFSYASSETENTTLEDDNTDEKIFLLEQENTRNTITKSSFSEDFSPQIDALTGIYYDELTDTRIEIESLCWPGARAQIEHFMTIHTKTEDGDEVVFRDVPAYYAEADSFEGAIIVSLGASYTDYAGIIMVECEMADTSHYTLRSDIVGCVDTDNTRHSLQNITRPEDLPRYTSYAPDHTSAMEQILASYPNEEFSDLSIFLTPEETEEALKILFRRSWYNWDTDATWRFSDTLINYQIIAAYNFNEMAYSVWYYKSYYPDQLCYISIPLQVGDPWWTINVYEPNPDGEMTSTAYWNMSYAEYQQMIADQQKDSITEQEIIDKVYNKAVTDLRNQAGGGVASLYHSATLDNSYVEYDAETDSYICLLNITYSTNIFDVFGTSKAQYAVSAVLVYTGTEWVIAYYEIM